MLRDRYEPMNLLALIPSLHIALESVLAQLDCLLDDDGLLATFGEVGSMSTSMWEIEKFPRRNDAVFPPLL
jgi:hypothetical protein